MCGIIGYIGKDNAIDYLRQGLKKLEYRGYDSAGIAFFNNAKIKTIKNIGTVDDLFKIVPPNLKSNVGIGHTRWATHGKALTENSHPHTSALENVCIVHNGIIENYLQLKKTFISDYNLKSETDTEIVANLIEKFYLKCNDKLKAINETIKLLKGSFALAIIFADESNAIYFAKQTSPLCIGTSKSGTLISSDVLGFSRHATSYIEINDGEFGRIGKNKIEIFDSNSNQIKFYKKPIKTQKADDGKNDYPHFMLKEIFEVPKTIVDTTKIYLSKNSPLSKIDENYFNFVERIHLVACGTSYHSCLIGENLLKSYGFDATSDIASEFIYSPQVLSKNTLCIFVSQSGETADTLTAIKLAKNYGAKTIGITNVMTSNITKLCDYTLQIKCGAEIAVASTKAYVGQLVMINILAEYLNLIKVNAFEKAKKIYTGNIDENIKNKKKMTKNDKYLKKNIKKMQNIANFIDIENYREQTRILIKEVINAKNVFMIGKDLDYVTAMESALKLKEISYINSVAYASGELKHGTISLVDENTLIFAFVTEKELISKTMNIIKQTQSRGAKIVLITPFIELLKDDCVSYKIYIPQIEEKFLPIISVVPMQLLAYDVSTALGYNPDKPRNLAKSVTVE